ncbi:DUF4175 family protein, partial [Mesonia mobilis]|uniref:DUF4175 family protein n=1 Tax=Mesonia mobilis TaxID=369791 RepID=UPI0034E89BA9
MNNYQLIKHKLEAFIRKYYLNELVKGAILFFSIGFLYFLITVSFEYFFWLNSLGRKILFWLFIGVEVALFGRFILYPLAKLFKLSKGINYEQASKIIGEHFPEVNDKLLNILQLHKNAKSNDSELLLASIDQKSLELQPIPFQIAVNFKSNLRYVKYAIIPVFIFLAIYISGNSNLFSESYTRVVNYDQAYEPPAPFSFQLNQDQLQVKENESLSLRIFTDGSVIPDNASIHYDGETYFLKKVNPGVFEYTFDRVSKNTEFYFSSNEVTSKPYQLQVINVPTLVNFEMQLDYPAYVGKQDEVLKGTGNATIPEGTKVSWNLTAKATNQIQLNLPDTLENFHRSEDQFSLQQQIFRNTSYQISTSNEQLKNYEQLSYQLKVVRDEFPELDVEMKRDSLDRQVMYFYGKVADDYGLTGLQLVYFASENPKETKKVNLPVSTSTFDDFVYAFPGDLQLDRGKAYEFYFQVFDNGHVSDSGFQELWVPNPDYTRISMDSTIANLIAKNNLNNIAEQQRMEYIEQITNIDHLTQMVPIINDEKCQACHKPPDQDSPLYESQKDKWKVRSVVKVSTSMKDIQDEIQKNTQASIIVGLVTIILVTLLLRVFMRGPVLKPLE